MRIRRPHRSVVFALQVLFVALESSAMNMPHYDVHSLAYMSTDIVVANLSESPDHKFTATVTETLYGSLHPNDRLDTLTPFLTYFQPMEDGMRVILFLDRRPHKYDFIHADAAKSPFAVPPSGVYLVDTYAHVHEYFQQNNPGPYVAEGYAYFVEKSVPSKEQDLALPSLDAVKRRIAGALEAVEPVRPLLDRVATRSDVPALMHLIDVTSNDSKDCDLRLAAAIREKALQQIRSLNDMALLLQAYSISGVAESVIYAPEFVQSGDFTNGNDTGPRVRYLVETLSDRKQIPALRSAAVQILLNLGTFHSGPHPGPSRVLPIDKNNWLASFASEIETISKSIFDDPSQDARLRALTLQFLALDDAGIVADVKRVYAHTPSAELRFAIEKAFLGVSDALYESLKPPGGPVSSSIHLGQTCGCTRLPNGGVSFVTDYRERKDFQIREGAFFNPHPAITNLRTGQHMVVQDLHSLGGWQSELEGHFEFELATLSSIPNGNYRLALEYSRDNKVLSTGYGLQLSIRETRKGKKLSIRNSGE
jgi:hypothetical protein